ncbi:Acyl-CoA dehydrogenase [Baekduia alba]|uniref:acyl-CoA dehydrogenase family protein n=1 Tax=Baekduia alba TaxID=2997333 RepID=UPI002341D8B2|nr:acyl-CoA dehydrogenase family protein [Baekduia alba]WCB93356.1 Acyl-CoA dehydrogenase [Baekduia alba]
MTTTDTAVPVLDAHLSEGHRALLTRTTELAATTLAPIAEAGRDGHVNRPLMAALAEHGLLGRLFTQEDGTWRPDVSALDLCLIREGLARCSTAAETAFAVQGLGSFPILQSGGSEAVEAWIPRIASGEAVAAFALSEPQAGTDVSALALAAAPDGDGYRLNGEKIWISNAPDADVYSVFARTTEGAGARGLTAFLVPRDSEGLTGERLAMVSPHPIGHLVFEDVFVPARHVLGERDRGMAVAMRTLDMFRPSVGAFGIGMAQAAIDATVAHANVRHAFGRPLRDFQAVSHRMADIATRVQAARLLVHHAAAAYDAGLRPTTQAAAMAKLMATEIAQEAVDAAIQFHGALALREGHLLEHLYREVRAPRIYEGASEIQREIIARALFDAKKES